MILSLEETIQEMINKSIAWEHIGLTNRIDALQADLDSKTRELEAMWEHVKPLTQQQMNKEVNTRLDFFNRLIP